MADPEADSVEIESMIEQARFLALEPYLISRSEARPINSNDFKGDKSSKSLIFPNPAKSEITILLGTKFVADNPVQIRLYNNMGKMLKMLEIKNTKQQSFINVSLINVSLAELPSGLYLAELTQKNTRESLKFTKQ